MSIAKIIADCSTIHSATTYIMEHEEWDFMGVYYDAIDHFCHGFMKYHTYHLIPLRHASGRGYGRQSAGECL